MLSYKQHSNTVFVDTEKRDASSDIESRNIKHRNETSTYIVDGARATDVANPITPSHYVVCYPSQFADEGQDQNISRGATTVSALIQHTNLKVREAPKPGLSSFDEPRASFLHHCYRLTIIGSVMERVISFVLVNES